MGNAQSNQKKLLKETLGENLNQVGTSCKK